MTYPVRQNTDTMKKIILICILCLSGAVCPARSSLKVFQLNLWNATTNVPGSEEGTVRTLKDIDADIVLLCEATTGKDTSLVRRIADRLSADGLHYYLSGAGHPVCMLTKEKPEKAEWTCIIPGNEERAILKVTLDIDGRPFAIYSAHLDHRNYQCYMPRGYSGSSWKKIDGPITDEATILEANRKSYRDESIRAFIEESAKDLAEGKTVIIGGDFNEPSHLDWGESTSGLRDHNGATVRWDCSAMLEEAGFTDAYREKHPDPVTWPGITYPAGNEEARKAGLNSLSWAPEADERERIDFIYYHSPSASFSVKSGTIVGPAATVIRDRIVKDRRQDQVLEPDAIWPSDHRGNLIVFSFKAGHRE